MLDGCFFAKPQVPLSQPPKPKGLSPSPIKVVPNQVPPLNSKSPCPSPQNLKSYPQISSRLSPSPTPKPQVPLSQPPKPKELSPNLIKVVPKQVPPLNPKSPCPSPQNLKSCPQISSRLSPTKSHP